MDFGNNVRQATAIGKRTFQPTQSRPEGIEAELETDFRYFVRTIQRLLEIGAFVTSSRGLSRSITRNVFVEFATGLDGLDDRFVNSLLFS